jgi:hypothetical protein
MDRPIEVMQLIDFFLLSQRSSDAAASIHSSRSIGQAFYWKRGPMLDCRYRGSRCSGTPDECSVAVLINEIQCINQNEGCFHVHYVCVHCAYDDQLSALADYERSPAIYRRVSVEMNLSSRSDG